MAEIKEVFEEMRSAHETLKEHVDVKLEEIRKSGSADPLLTDKIERINTDLTELRAKHDELVKAAQRPSAAGKGEVDDPEMELRKSSFLKYLTAGKETLNDAEKRALSNSSDGDGGFLVPTAFENDIITQAYDEGELRAICNVAPTGRDVVQLSALSKPTTAWGTQNLAVTAQDITAGGERIEIYDLKALTLISNNTLDDAAADVWGELRDMFSMSVAEEEDDAFATGAGNQPQGVISDSRVQANYVPSGVAAALSDSSNNGVDALITMLHTLKKVYRRNATWAMNSTTEGVVRQFKDANGQYLWQPATEAGGLATLLGRPIVNPEAIADVAANSFSIALGDFRKGYKIRDRSGITVQRLTERYAEFDQTGFLIKKRLGGQVTLSEAFVLLKTATS